MHIAAAVAGARHISRTDESGRSGQSLLGEAGGACGDLGTLLPHAIGAMTVAGLQPAGVLCGFGAFLVASGIHYGIPIAVQPMKAVSAVMLGGGLTPAEVAATGLLVGVTLLVLAATGLIDALARAVPKSVVTGLQLGLGLSMVALGFRLAASDWMLAAGLAGLALVLLRTRLPAAPLLIAAAIGSAAATGSLRLPDIVLAPALPAFALPHPDDLDRAFLAGLLPQLPLTLTNAVILTAMIARELYPQRGRRASERRLACGTGLANLVLAPFGAMPMCHGAGGLVAQHRFGARTGLAPVLLGLVLLTAGLGFAASAPGLLAAIPAGAIGVLVGLAGLDLAVSRRLTQARPDCWPAIGAAAAGTLLVNPAAGLAAGWAIEAGRSWLGDRRLRAGRNG